MQLEPDGIGFYTSYVSMNWIGLDRIGLGFEPNWTEPVFLGEFEGAEPPHTLAGGCGDGGSSPHHGPRDSERASSR